MRAATARPPIGSASREHDQLTLAARVRISSLPTTTPTATSTSNNSPPTAAETGNRSQARAGRLTTRQLTGTSQRVKSLAVGGLIRDNLYVAGSARTVFRSLTGSALDSVDVPAQLAVDGIVLFTHPTRQTLTESVASWAVARAHPHADSSAFTSLEPRPSMTGAGTLGFAHDRLWPHTDRALTSRPPSLMALIIERAAAEGGQSLLVDMRRAVREHCGSPRLALVTDGSGVWPILEINVGLARIRFRDDEVAHPRALDPAGQQLLTRIRKLTTETMVLRFEAGEGYLLHNHRILHGRTSFTGDRLAARLLADVQPEHGFAWLNQGFSI